MYEKFIEVLSELGGKATNKAMLAGLGWDKQEYLECRKLMVKNDVIKLAKGRGGSVVLIAKVQPKVVDPFPQSWR